MPVSNEVLEAKRNTYNGQVAKFGEANDGAIREGLDLAKALLSSKHHIECHRLSTALLATSVRLRGEDHGLTRDMKEISDECAFNSRLVLWFKENELRKFEALRYKHGGATCVMRVLQPMKWHRNDRIAAPSNEIRLQIGNVVVCRNTSSHLDGKLGQVTSWNEESDEYGILFEDESFASTSVKRQNLRIAVELFGGGKDQNRSAKKEVRGRVSTGKAGGQSLPVSTSTDWHRERENNTISPKQRLINYCELSSLKTEEDDIPEEGAVHIDTPYSYWGLPSCGKSGKWLMVNEPCRASLRRTHCLSVDFTWLVDNAEIVVPFFDEVSKMGRHKSWAGIIDDLKGEILLDVSSPIKDKNMRRKMRNFQLSSKFHENPVLSAALQKHPWLMMCMPP